MLSALVAIHCTVGGMFFAAGFILEKLGVGIGKAFGLPGKETPTWQLALLASVWELYLIGVGLDILKDKHKELKNQ